MRLLNKEFCEGVKAHLCELEVWQTLCYDETIFDCRTLVMARRHPYELVQHQNTMTDQEMWRGTYLAFKKWQKVTESPQSNRSMLSVSHLSTFITCITTFDKFLAVSFANGQLNCYDYSADEVTKPAYSLQHSHQIQQCDLWYSKNSSKRHPALLLVVVRDSQDHLSFWDMKNKTRLFAPECRAYRICVGECRYFCIGEYDGILTSYERNLDNQIVPGASVDLNLRPSESIINLCIDGKYIAAMSVAAMRGKVGTVIYLLEAVIKNKALVELEMEQEKDMLMLPVKLSNLTRLVMPTITFYFGLSESNLMFSTNFYENEWHTLDLGILNSPVTAAALHAQILMLGLENGEIHLLRIENYVSIINLETEMIRSAGRKVTDKPIIDITIMEYQQNPSIVVATADELFLINFEDFS